MPNRLTASTSPHIHSHELTSQAMWAVFLALVPAGIAGVFIFGLSALKIIVISILSCMIFEVLIQRLTRRKVTVLDGSAAITGILLAYNLPSNVPFWIPIVGSFFAIVIVKLAFGGLGRNIFNPALAARAFLLASWPKYMTDFDAITGATPLAMIKEGKAQDLAGLGLTYWDLFLGKRGGCIGEVCILALLIGAIYLLWKKHIWWQTPIAFILTLGGLSWAFGVEGFFKGDFLFSILSGGLILGAFFMATDYVTSPLCRRGQLVFGIGCGLITFVIRRFGGYPEGVSYAILIMNAFVPLIDRHIRPRVYGR
ncbi:MAG: RnfABCDGE type electron transport complex subunit D [Candidatus Omnitrophica bacterium]|nr:RnfABCDGE type electron transport complex subunit D [Candidatus Omnitrophota bacterium]